MRSLLPLLVLAIPPVAVACAIVASAERIRGTPIPRFRNSKQLKKQRAYIAVPVGMGVAFTASLPLNWHFFPFTLIFALATAGALGWIVFAVLWVVLEVRRLFGWLLSG